MGDPGLDVEFPYTFEVEQQERVVEKPFTDEDLNAIRDEIAKILANGRCKEFLSRLLNIAGAGDDPPVYKDMLDLFDAVRKQGGFVSATLYPRTGSSRGFSEANGAVGALEREAKIRLSSSSDDWRHTNNKLRISYHAYNALAELTHVAGTQVSNYVEGAFSDYNLGVEAGRLANVMGHGVKNLNPTPPNVNPYKDAAEGTGKWSNYYHNIVKLFCKRNERP